MTACIQMINEGQKNSKDLLIMITYHIGEMNVGVFLMKAISFQINRVSDLCTFCTLMSIAKNKNGTVDLVGPLKLCKFI